GRDGVVDAEVTGTEPRERRIETANDWPGDGRAPRTTGEPVGPPREHDRDHRTRCNEPKHPHAQPPAEDRKCRGKLPGEEECGAAPTVAPTSDTVDAGTTRGLRDQTPLGRGFGETRSQLEDRLGVD